MEKSFAFSIGDQVWLMHKNAAVCGIVVKLFYYKGISCVNFETVSENERYYVSVNGRSIGDFDKKDLFETKEDLLESL